MIKFFKRVQSYDFLKINYFLSSFSKPEIKHLYTDATIYCAHIFSNKRKVCSTKLDIMHLGIIKNYTWEL